MAEEIEPVGPRSDPVMRTRAARLQRRAEFDVLRHKARAWVETKKDEIDSEAVADAITCATEEELRYYDYARTLADGSEVKREIILTKLALMSDCNNRRIARRFRR